jgi:dTDP-4-dehydrorhamnose 3,5-epimerase/reductase
MNDAEIFIVGANGQLGKALKTKYPGAQSADIAELDITNKASVAQYDWTGIKIILNAAAYTNVDGAETTEGRIAAWAVNADAVGNLVALAAQNDITLVHISTDYVFDGTQSPHKEDEPFSPLSVYGSSKAAGDLLVSLAPKFYILRTSWVIGDGKNFVKTMLDLGNRGIHPSVVSDQIGRLTFTSQLVAAIDFLLTKDAPFGTYNVTNKGESVSWAAITREIFALAGLENSVADVTTAEYFSGKTGIAPRPLQSTLDLSKITSLGFVPSEWQDDLKVYIDKEISS